MTDSAIGFGEAAVKLSRSPLGVIALFIVLVDFFAAAVLGPFGGNLDSDQRWTLLVFIVSFPIIVFGTFAWLIVKHYTKLYAPFDYRTDEAFLRPLTPAEQGQRLAADIGEDAEGLRSVAPGSISPKEPVPSDSGPSPQQDVGVQAEQAARRRVARAKADHLLAEDLALKKIEIEEGAPIQRQVALTIAGRTVEFDGVIRRPAQLVAVEVQLLNPKNAMNRVDDIIGKASAFAHHARTVGKPNSFQLALAFVIPPEVRNRESLRERVMEAVRNSGIYTATRFYDLDHLKTEFGLPQDDGSAPNSKAGS